MMETKEKKGSVERSRSMPKLRFPEFKDEWDKQKLKNLAHFQAGYAFKSGDMSSELEDYQIVKMSNVYKNELLLDRNPSFVNSINEKSKKVLLKQNDVVLTFTGTVGKRDYGYSVNIPESNKFLLNQRLVLLRGKKENSLFISYLLKTDKFYYSFFNESKGGTGNQANVSSDDVKNIKLYSPAVAEQQKIASFLSAVDEKINQLKRKKELLQAYKKGMMQQLFSQQLRFKDQNGNDFPEWEEKKLGDVFEFFSTNSFSRDKMNEEKGEVKNIHYGDIHTKYKALVDVECDEVPYVNQDVDLSKIKIENYCKDGDLILADASEDYNDIGKSIEVKNIGDLKVLAGLHTILARPKIQFSEGFLGQYVQSWFHRKQVMFEAQGTKVLGISVGRLKRIKIQIPSKEEQTKIAMFLLAFDAKIDTVSTAITKTQDFKKGLLQQMFV